MAHRWTLEQLKHLQELEAAVTPEVAIHIIPISKGGRDVGYGSQIAWDARIYRKGIMGPRPVTKVELEAVGVAPEEAERWVSQTQRAVQTLNRLYPVLVPAVEARVKAIQAAIPEVLPPPEEKVATKEVEE